MIPGFLSTKLLVSGWIDTYLRRGGFHGSLSRRRIRQSPDSRRRGSAAVGIRGNIINSHDLYQHSDRACDQ
jgi:hypothetical protein